MKSLVLAGLLFICSACSPEPTPAVVTADQPEDAPAAPRFDPAKVERMKAKLLEEPKIKDVLYTPSPGSVEWQVGVYDDGSSRVGYAGYVCLKLREDGLVDKQTDVRIVDVVKAQASGGDLRGASLGHIDCTTERDLGT